MAKKERVKRGAPERDHPQRNGIVTPRNGAVPDAGRTTLGNGRRTGQRLAEAASATLRGAVERGVETAYVVCEEYLARGREEALRQQQRSTSMSDSSPQNTMFDQWAQAWGPMAPMVAPMMAPWAQMMRIWTDGMSMWAPGFGGLAQQLWSPWAWAEGNPFNSPFLSVSVTSKNPAVVTTKIQPGVHSSLEVAGLEPDSGGGKPLEGVTFVCKPDHITINVDVPDRQRPATYSGPVVDSNGVTQGSISVEVQKGPQKS